MSIESLDEGNREDRAYDHLWIGENLHRFASLAQAGFKRFGRGVVLVNLAELIVRKHIEEGHPFNYHAPSGAWFDGAEITPDSLRVPLLPLLLRYVPEQEFVLLLVKSQAESLHRVPLSLSHSPNAGSGEPKVEVEPEEVAARLNSTDFWARDHPLTTPHTAEWLYRMSGPAKGQGGRTRIRFEATGS